MAGEERPLSGPTSEPSFDCFVFLNRQNLITANNLRVGGDQLSSASWGLYPERLEDLLAGRLHWRMDLRDDPAQGGFISPFAVSQFQKPATAQLEMDAERIRAERYPNSPSRLAGLFVFPDEATCHIVSSVHGWDMRQATSARATFARAGVHDMEIASLAHSMYSAGSIAPATAEALWDAYWAGKTINELSFAPPRVPIPELLIDGWIICSPST